MWEKIRSIWSYNKEYRCRLLKATPEIGGAVHSRQDGVFGFNQRKFSMLCITLVGAGGINGEIGEGLVRKGIGKLILFDGDTVESSNLNRQFFAHRDIGKNKAFRLAKNLQRMGFLGSRITAHPLYVQEFLENGGRLKTELLVCGVDNNPTRVYVSRLAISLALPAVFTAVSRAANQGYVFIQEKEGPCFGCAFPEAINDDEYPCPGTPAIKDILKVVAGFVLYAIDTVLLDRKRNGNYRMMQLAG